MFSFLDLREAAEAVEAALMNVPQPALFTNAPGKVENHFEY